VTLRRLGLGSALVLSACGLITGPGEDDRLEAARRRWAAEGQRDYSYEIRSDCFCGLAGRWIEVTVLGNQVAAGRYLDTDTPVEPNFLGALPTVADLFARIDDAVSAHPVLLQVDYDSRDGHPTRINVDVSYSIADEEYLLQSRNLMGLLTASGTTPPR
jgi:uncharacterized protein DUF6174